MGLFDSIKRLVGMGENRPAETEGSDVTVHVEHPGVDEADEAVDDADLEDIKGIGPTYADRLRDAGIASIRDLSSADAEALAGETEISETRLATWIERARVRTEGP